MALAPLVGRAVRGIPHVASRMAWHAGGQEASQIARLGWRGTKAMTRGAGRAATSNFGSKAIIGGAMVAGVGASLLKDATSPEVQEALTGAPDAFYRPGPGTSRLTTSMASAVLLGNYNEKDLNDPFAASARGGAVVASPNYLYGRSIAGDTLGNIKGSAVMGGFSMSQSNRQRIKGYSGFGREQYSGSGRDDKGNITDGSMVFGMWHSRR